MVRLCLSYFHKFFFKDKSYFNIVLNNFYDHYIMILPPIAEKYICLKLF